MGTSTEELTGQIADTRQSLAADVDALQDRVSPSAVVERQKAAARRRLGGVKDRVMGTAHSVTSSASSAPGSAVGSAQDTARSAAGSVESRTEGSPLAMGAAAFAAGVVVAALLPTSEKESRAARQVVDTAKDKAQPLVEDARHRGQDLGSSLKDTAMDAAQQVRETAQDAAGTVRDQGSSSAGTVRSEASRS